MRASCSHQRRRARTTGAAATSADTRLLHLLHQPARLGSQLCTEAFPNAAASRSATTNAAARSPARASLIAARAAGSAAGLIASVRSAAACAPPRIAGVEQRFGQAGQGLDAARPPGESFRRQPILEFIGIGHREPSRNSPCTSTAAPAQSSAALRAANSSQSRVSAAGSNATWSTSARIRVSPSTRRKPVGPRSASAVPICSRSPTGGR
jgi:hypothetical protein